MNSTLITNKVISRSLIEFSHIHQIMYTLACEHPFSMYESSKNPIKANPTFIIDNIAQVIARELFTLHVVSSKTRFTMQPCLVNHHRSVINNTICTSINFEFSFEEQLLLLFINEKNML